MSEQTTKPKAAAAVALTSAHVNAQIVEAAWHRGFADHAAVQRAGEEAVRKMFGDDECAT